MGRRLAIHKLSLLPPQPNQCIKRKLANAGVFRSTGARPWARAIPSVKARSVWWHEMQAT